MAAGKPELLINERTMLFFRYNDVDQATNAKIEIEQKQRDEAQIRKERNENWEPRVISFLCV